jgi:hypothetical protein
MRCLTAKSCWLLPSMDPKLEHRLEVALPPAIRTPAIMFLAPSERRRVRGKDCVLLRSPYQAIASLNSFLPRLADTGRNRKELT